jgi:hypothetical protein
MHVASLDLPIGVPEQLHASRIERCALSVQIDPQHTVACRVDECVDFSPRSYGIPSSHFRFGRQASQASAQATKNEHGPERQDGETDRDPRLEDSQSLHTAAPLSHLALDRAVEFTRRHLELIEAAPTGFPGAGRCRGIKDGVEQLLVLEVPPSRLGGKLSEPLPDLKIQPTRKHAQLTEEDVLLVDRRDVGLAKGPVAGEKESLEASHLSGLQQREPRATIPGGLQSVRNLQLSLGHTAAEVRGYGHQCDQGSDHEPNRPESPPWKADSAASPCIPIGFGHRYSNRARAVGPRG